MTTSTPNPNLDYGDLSIWSDLDWQAIDIHEFIYANFRRYVGIVKEKVGAQNMSYDAYEVLPSLFLDRGFKPLRSLHSKHLNTQGQRRNQIMLGTLKEIARTRICEAVIKEFPFSESLDEEYYTDSVDDYDDSANGLSALGNTPVDNLFTQNADIVVNSTLLLKEKIQTEVAADLEINTMLSLAKPLLTNNQYRHVRARVCEGKSIEEIARDTGKTVSNARITLKNARKRFHKVLPDAQRKKMASNVSKNFAKKMLD